MPQKPRALISAYAFSPTLGSEFAQAWNYVQEMKARYDLTVLVGSSDGRMGDFTLLDHPAAAALAREVQIVPVQPDWFCRAIKWLDVKVGLSWLFVLGLRRWHWLAFNRAVELHGQKSFQVAHQLGPIGFRNPGYLYRLPVPSYWGPVGGFQYVILRLAFQSDLRYGLIALVRNVLTFLAARAPHVGSALRGFRRLSFATETNRRNFQALHGVSGPVLSGQAVVSDLGRDAAPTKPGGPPLLVVWCGSIDGRKNIQLLLDVSARLQAQAAPVAIAVIGTGPLHARAARQAAAKGLTNIRFLGQVPRDEVREQLRGAHVLCSTSLSEGNPGVFYEALEAHCVPVALDLDGFSTDITPSIGYKIDPRLSWNAIVGEYARILRTLAERPDLLALHVQAIREEAPRLHWKTLADRHHALLGEVQSPAPGR